MEPAGSPGLRPSLPEWAMVSSARREHIERVAELAGRWAMEMGVPDSERHRWLRAVWLHDALRDAPEGSADQHVTRLVAGALGRSPYQVD